MQEDGDEIEEENQDSGVADYISEDDEGGDDDI